MRLVSIPRFAISRLPSLLANSLYPLARYHVEPVLKDPRWPYFEKAFRHIAAEGIEGDYLEFGVYRGRSIMMAFMLTRKFGLKHMRFLGFDSFLGLPSSEGPYPLGAARCSRAQFIRYVRDVGVDTRRVEIIEGLYSDSLNEQVKIRHKIANAAVVHVDCDLYLSARDVLGFVENLMQPGSILIFDEWHGFTEMVGPTQVQNYGEQKAFAEWPLRGRFTEFYDTDQCRAFIMG